MGRGRIVRAVRQTAVGTIRVERVIATASSLLLSSLSFNVLGSRVL